MGDFNRDGNLDLATVPGTAGDMGISLGNGDGTFKPMVNYSLGIGPPLADVNSDGILDMVSFGIGFHSVAVMLGNGDGTFQKARTVITSKTQIGDCGFGLQIVVTDFNADGKADLAYCERDIQANRGKIWVALGNGDGTFQKPVSLRMSAYQGAISFTVGDFNSDGKTDLLANYFTSGKLDHTETDLFLGNGDGTFQPKKIINLPGKPYYNSELGFAVADFNSDGLLDFISKAPGEFDVFVQK